VERSSPKPASGWFLAADDASSRRSGVWELVRVAADGLLANKLRSFLTTLGVTIGVGAVIVMVSLGQGAAKATEDSIKRLGTNRLYIRPEDQQVRGVNQGQGTGNNLRLEDAEILRREARFITTVAPEVRANGVRVEYRGENTVTEVYGATREYFPVRNLEIEQGRIFTEGEVESKARVAVLGYEVYEELYNGGSPVGTTVMINNQPFEVIGLQKKMGAVPYGNRDDQVTIPISTSMRRLFRQDRIRGISAQAVSLARMPDAEEEIKRILAKAHRLKPDEPPDVRIHNQADLIETATTQSSFLTMLLAGIALVSLVVGGIGVMNIMLVSVTERTREIGIRRAIGAKRRDILYQFLIESVSLCLVGGVLGVVAGIGIAWFMGRPAEEGGLGFPMVLSVPAMVVSFASSGVVGIFCGIYPAVNAAHLDPITALRHE
jgi:putative ABC transport system permease protein